MSPYAGVGSFENYPNRNSVPYKDIYGLKDAHPVSIGSTFRILEGASSFLSDQLVELFKDRKFNDVFQPINREL